MKRGMLAVAALVACCAAPAWGRDVCQMLKDKGLLNDVEFNECRASVEREAADSDKKTQDVLASKWPKWLDMFVPFGDFRFRQEGFYEKGMVANNRFRIRGRLGLLVNPIDEVQAGFRIATGNPNDPISTNQTLGSEFTRKSISLDWAFLNLRPYKVFGWDRPYVGVTGGKFQVPAFRPSELVWDDDLSPEGGAEVFSLVESKEGFWRSVKVHTFQWTVDQIRADADPWMWGGQAAADMAFGSTAMWTAALANYNYQGMNAVAKGPLNPKNSNFNSALANSNDVITQPNGAITAYKYQFNIFNVNSDLDFSNPFGVGIPAGAFFDFAYNTQAATRNLGVYLGAGLGNARRDFYHDSLRNAGDWGASVTWVYVEKDAVLSLFSYSDFQYIQTNAPPKSNATLLGSTNVQGAIVRFDYAPWSFVQLTAKAHIINALDRAINNAPLVGNPTLVRTQFDAVVKF